MNQSFYSPGCIQCGSFLIEASLFCAYCFEKFIKPRIESCYHSDTDISHRHVFLIEWNKSDDHLLAQLVYRLKASQSPEAILFYSDLLAEKLIEEVDISFFSALIPVPGSSPKRIHAELIARRLSKMTGLHSLPLLEKDQQARQQKKLSSKERRLQNPFKLRQGLTDIAPEDFTVETCQKQPLLFVDDVLTTGQSIKHAESILNGDKRNAVATLFYRPPQ